MKKLTIAFCLLLSTSVAYSQSQVGSFGVRAGIGTDISLGIAYGGNFNYRMMENFELGLNLFGGKFSETSDNGFNIYEETTSVFVLGAMGTWLYKYRPEEKKPYFLTSAGLGFVSYDWEERSDTDSSLGTLLPGGGSMQSESGSTGGLLLGLGIGYTFGSPFDLRFDVPILVPFAEAVGVVPLFMLTAGYRF
jgi:hypothetical protein